MKRRTGIRLPHLALFFATFLLTVVACFAVRLAAADNPRGVSGRTFTFIEPDNATGTSEAVVVNGNPPLAYSGQALPLDRQGKLIGAADVARQANQVLQNLDRMLKAAGSGLMRVVRLNICLARANDMLKVQQTLASRFAGEQKPAVSFVVGNLPKRDALVAMDAVAVSSEHAKVVKHIAADSYADGIASVAVLPAGPKIYLSGMADTNSLPFATQKTLEKLVAAIGHLGLQREDIVQLKAFLQPLSEVESVRREIAQFFDGHAPPVVFVEWISQQPNPPIEIELVAKAKGDFSKETDSVSFITPPGTTDSNVFKRVTRVNHGGEIYVSGLYGTESSDAARQIREIFGSLSEVLKAANSDFEHLAKATYYVTDEEASKQLNEIRPQFYNPQRPPAASKAQVNGVGPAGKTVTLDMIAVTK